MDNHKELIERLKIDAEWAEGQEWETPLCLWDDLMDAVSAIATLTEENARLRAELEQAKEKNAGLALALLYDCNPNEDCIGENEWSAIGSELEQVKRERDGIKSAFEDVASKPNCNTCCDRSCMYRPRAGETTRFNCPLWRGRNPK